MAIIYTYPQINSSSDLAASDLMIISDMSANGRPTKSLKLSDLATFITNTGTGSGTTNKITKWTDGANGVLGDSSITDNGTQVSMSSDFIINSNGGNNAKFITDWGDHRVSILDALGAYTFTAADLDGGGKIGVNKQFPSTTLHVGGTGTFDSSLSIPLIPTANAHATSKQYVDQQIASIPAGLVFQGNWNANTNTPTLASGVGTVGNYYVVSVAGNTNLDGITDWQVGDWAVFVEVGGVDKWDKIDQTFVSGSGAAGQVTFWNTINTVDMPFQKRVVEKIESKDTVTGFQKALRYKFENGKYDRNEKQFLGFGNMFVTDASGTFTETRFHNNDILHAGKSYYDLTQF